MSASVAHLSHARFDRAVAELNELDHRARVALDTETGMVRGVDGCFEMELTSAIRALPETDQAAAASVLFLDRVGAAFGLAGWHVLTPEAASPLGSTIWFTFTADADAGPVRVHVCADAHRILHVRVESVGDADTQDRSSNGTESEPYMVINS